MEKNYFWLTFGSCGDMSTLEMKTKDNKAKLENLKQFLWFEESEEDDARSFLKDLKTFIKCRYASNPKYKDRAEWCTDEWINKF